MSPAYAQVLLDGPLAGSYTYRIPAHLAVAPGQWAVVPWGKTRRVGIVEEVTASSRVAEEKLRDLEQLLPELPPLAAQWLTFIRFAAGYYQGEPAELGLGSVPRLLRVPPSSRTRKRADTRLADFDPAPSFSPENTSGLAAPSRLTAEQQAVLDRLTSDELPAKGCAEETLALKGPVQAVAKPWLLHGVTGSGKTEIYLRWFRSLLDSSPEVQVLLLVPEIGLTPSLLTQLRRRFAGESIAVLHSEMPDAARASNWMAAASGKARIVLGTRLAVLAQIPKLAAIVVDEEQDPSFKQQEGIRYSARDMAIARASMAGLPIVLGSATPSLESWNNARTDRYRLLQLTARAGGTDLPTIRVVPLRGAKLDYGLTGAALEAIRGTLGRSEQALVFLNRRGYAPVMSCDACGWLSRCDHCDAFRVLHRLGDPRNPGPSRYRLICHHCAAEAVAPRACPACGNQDLAALGRGTQRLEEGLAELFPAARVARLDRDVASRRGATERFLAAAHAGEVDLLIGTQMLAKGHDFTRLTLVVVVDADAGLFASDFSAPERLFATLMQVAGRAGRHSAAAATTLIQTRYPEHPLFATLKAHDYAGFAAAELHAREASGLPPFAHQALLLAQARKMESTLAFLQLAREHLLSLNPPPQLNVCDPVPMPLAKLRDLSRAQLLVECSSRPHLHQFLASWRQQLDPLADTIRGAIRWQLVIDPIEI
ncbi:MAG TPA: primosomal protein N' [Lautropia sp.]|nr:primosomal protein N' [Lautropia sp.]